MDRSKENPTVCRVSSRERQRGWTGDSLRCGATNIPSISASATGLLANRKLVGVEIHECRWFLMETSSLVLRAVVVCPSLVLFILAAQKKSNRSGRNKHILRRKLLVWDDNLSGWRQCWEPPGSSLAAGLREPPSFKGTQHPPNLASQLGNSKDSWPVEVVLVLDRGRKRVRAGAQGYQMGPFQFLLWLKTGVRAARGSALLHKGLKKEKENLWRPHVGVDQKYIK